MKLRRWSVYVKAKRRGKVVYARRRLFWGRTEREVLDWASDVVMKEFLLSGRADEILLSV